MSLKRTSLAVALCASLAAGGVALPQAEAAVAKSGQQLLIDAKDPEQKLPYFTAKIDRGANGVFTFVHPGAAVSGYTFNAKSDVTVDGRKVQTDWNTEPATGRSGGADTVTFTRSESGVEVTRTFAVSQSVVTTSVTVRNTGEAAQDVRVDLGVHTPTHFSYDASVDYGGGTGQFDGALNPGEERTVHANITVRARESALDSDGDGLRDSWERSGMTLSDGSLLPIHQWGADEEIPDLFLQLNWMKTEWETLGCDRTTAFPATAEGFAEFARCARANTNDYGPKPETLKQLERLFASYGVQLHIDAGEGYVSESMSAMPPSKRQGGAKLDYQPYFFGPNGNNESVVGDRLRSERDRLLGPRKSAFRVGIIGDKRAPGNESTGVALTGDSVFYVANFDAMTRQDELRNTILHEFGHTLGLKHWGAQVPENTAPHVDELPEYKSVMTYSHQLNLDLFDYASGPTQTDSYFIPADWPHLHFAGNNIGRNAVDYVGGSAGEPAAKAEVVGETKTMDELIEAAAEQNDGKAGFRMLSTQDGRNGIITLSANNAVRGEVSNLGSKTETFTVEAEHNGIVTSKEVTLGAAGRGGARKVVDLPINPAILIDNPVVQVNVRVKDSTGKTVFSDGYKVSALQYTSEEASNVLRAVLASDADESVKKLAREVLSPTPESGGTGEDDRRSSVGGDGASTAAIVVGVLLGVVGLGALAYGWAVNQGIVKLPF